MVSSAGEEFFVFSLTFSKVPTYWIFIPAGITSREGDSVEFRTFFVKIRFTARRGGRRPALAPSGSARQAHRPRPPEPLARQVFSTGTRSLAWRSERNLKEV